MNIISIIFYFLCLLIVNYTPIVAMKKRNVHLKVHFDNNNNNTNVSTPTKRKRDSDNELYDQLITAIKNRDLQTVKALIIDDGNVNINQGDYNFQVTPLHYAAMYGFDEIIEILIKHKADVNAQDSSGLTPLHNAVGRYLSERLPQHIGSSEEFIRCINLLLEHGANPHIKDLAWETTPLDYAKEYSSIKNKLCKSINIGITERHLQRINGDSFADVLIKDYEIIISTLEQHTH